MDLSNTYLEWAERNFYRNRFDPDAHIFQRSDILRWLPREVSLNRRYDVIVLDPPTFSRSAKMERDFDVQRDHVELIESALKLLAHDGEMLFSTNFRRFELDEEAIQAQIEEITDETTPQDFRPGIHRAWRLRRA